MKSRWVWVWAFVCVVSQPLAHADTCDYLGTDSGTLAIPCSSVGDSTLVGLYYFGNAYGGYESWSGQTYNGVTQDSTRLDTYGNDTTIASYLGPDGSGVNILYRNGADVGSELYTVGPNGGQCQRNFDNQGQETWRGGDCG